MKAHKHKWLQIQAFASDDWRDVVQFDTTQKNEAVSLLQYKKKVEKSVKWRLIQRVISEKKIA